MLKLIIITMTTNVIIVAPQTAVEQQFVHFYAAPIATIVIVAIFAAFTCNTRNANARAEVAEGNAEQTAHLNDA
jgi:hypothetical protein